MYQCLSCGAHFITEPRYGTHGTAPRTGPGCGPLVEVDGPLSDAERQRVQETKDRLRGQPLPEGSVRIGGVIITGLINVTISGKPPGLLPPPPQAPADNIELGFRVPVRGLTPVDGILKPIAIRAAGREYRFRGTVMSVLGGGTGPGGGNVITIHPNGPVTAVRRAEWA